MLRCCVFASLRLALFLRAGFATAGIAFGVSLLCRSKGSLAVRVASLGLVRSACGLGVRFVEPHSSRKAGLNGSLSALVGLRSGLGFAEDSLLVKGFSSLAINLRMHVVTFLRSGLV
jgi:hypothetical protein